MKLKTILIQVLLLTLTICAQAQNVDGTFTVATMNVDGLPPKILIATINEDGPQETGTTRMSELIAQKGWDFFSVSEDFNYNSSLLTYLADYSYGTFRGKINANNMMGLTKFNTDGLNLFWKTAKCSVANESIVAWNQSHGNLKDGADENIDKGYRYYTLTFNQPINGHTIVLDVYILHMDAETGEADNAARASQLTQLANAILGTNNARPIIVMGDTNCRYTRDELKRLFFDALTADNRFTVNDPWVDVERGGIQPKWGDGAIMTDAYGQQRGEVVDKLFYINNSDAGYVIQANSYLHDTSFTYANGTPISDHFPVVVNFSVKDALSVNEPRYLRNVATGRFLNVGKYWDTHATLGEWGTKILLNELPDATYRLGTTLGSMSHNDNDPYMDTESTSAGTWKVNASGNAASLTYEVNGTTYALTDENNADAVATCTTYSGTTDQQWEVLTRENLLDEMRYATEQEPYDATFLLPAARIGRNDCENLCWSVEKTNANYNLQSDFGWKTSNINAEFYAWAGSENSAYDAYQEINVPNGVYTLKCQGFFRDGNHDTNSRNVNAVLYANSFSTPLCSILDGAQSESLGEGYRNAAGWIPDNQTGASRYFTRGLYRVTLDNIEVTDGKLRLGVKKTTTDALESWSCFDNFQLIYQGRNDWSLGDVNMDGLVNINDVVSLVNYILGQTPHPFNLQAADTSADNTINIADIVSLVNIILQ